jgi:polysaccharide pyruvyl transferase WcaK-like protein
MNKVKETQSLTQEKTGDEAEYQKKRKAVAKSFGVESCSALKDPEKKKACYKALDDAHVADHEEQVKKEEVKVSGKTKEYKDVVSKILGRRKEVQEAVTIGGIEYGEQEWDKVARLDHIAPYLDQNFAEFHEQGLEGPYLWHGETYFFDRKVGSWYSVTAEDFVDDEISKDLSLAYVKDGLYKRQFAS